MNTIKKTTLVVVITAMAAFAVPSMASAAVWNPGSPNFNKTLTSTSAAKYAVVNDTSGIGFQCSSSTLGVHVRSPASSTLDITSASFTGCSLTATVCSLSTPVTVTATGLPWAATTSFSNVTFTEHLQVTNPCYPGYTFTLDGPAKGMYFNTTHTLSAVPDYPNMKISLMGTPVGIVGNADTAWWHETTNTLNLT